jgi:hypothetical protein
MTVIETVQTKELTAGAWSMSGMNLLSYAGANANIGVGDTNSLRLVTNNQNHVVISGTGRTRFAINSSNGADASSLVEFASTSYGILLPRMTTAQKNAIGSPVAGLVVYDASLNKLCVYTGAAWETITSA